MKKSDISKRHIWTRLFAAVVAISMVMCIFAGCEKVKEEEDPLELLKQAINNTADTVTESTASTAIDDSFRGSVEFKMNASELQIEDDQLAGMEGLGIEASIKAYFDFAAKAFGLQASAGGLGMNLINAMVYLNDSFISLTTGGLIGEFAYGVTFNDIANRFDSSIFGPDGEYSLGISSAEIAEYFAAATESSFDAEQLAADAEQTAKAFMDTLYASVEENAEISKEQGEVQMLGSKVDTTDIVIEIDYETMLSIAEDMLAFIRDNENLRRMIDALADFVAENTEDFDEASIDELFDSIDDAFAELEEMKADADEVEGIITLTFNILEDKEQLVGCALETVELDDNIEFSLTFGPDVENFEFIRFRMNNNGEKVDISAVIDETDDSNEYEASVSVDVSVSEYEIAESHNIKLGVRRDKTSGDAEAYCELDGESVFSIGCNIKTEGDITTVALGRMTAIETEPVDLSGFYIIINNNDPIPDGSQFEDLLDMTAEEFEDLLEKIEGLVGMFS